jgi:phosphoglycolate phosphatase
MLVGDGLPVLCRRVLEASSGPPGDERVEELRQSVMRRYDSHLIVHTELYPGIAGLLDALRAAQAPMAVLSNKPDRHTRRIAEALVPAGTFRTVIGHRPDLPRKPDPAAALHTAELLETPPGQCLLVGDSGVDMQTARTAGMIPVGVLWGFRGRDELESEGARFLVEDPKEIAALVLGPERRSDC